MYNNYDIFAVLDKSITDFDQNSIQVIPSDKNDSNRRYLGNGNEGYQFSQRELLNDIDMAYNSVYKNGKYDKEGQRKAYLNVVRFYVQVAVKNTNPTISQYNFTPVDYSLENIWGVWFTKRQFANFVRDEEYDKTEDAVHFDFCKYGTGVTKKVKDDILRVPLRALRCDQSACSLEEGVEGGIPLTVEHEMSYVQYQEYKDTWAEIDLYDGKRKVYEMYTYMPRAEMLKLQGKDPEEKDHKELILTMSIIMPANKDEAKSNQDMSQKVLFIEELAKDEFPLEEVHSEKQDGRWLGIGNVEKQLENQLARNMAANMRRRAMMWSSKNIFQMAGESLGKNLVSNVQDGEVLAVGLNGQIQRVDTTTRGLADFAQDEQIWEDNGQKQSFAFEAATGESMSSGTPFRLGAMLSNSVMGYFDGQKEIFGRFRENMYYNFLIPIFKRRAKNDIVIISQTDEGFHMIKEMLIDYNINKYYTDLALSDKYFETNVLSREEVKAMLMESIKKHPELYLPVTKEMYKNAKYTIKLDLSKKTPAANTETLTTVYTEMSRKGDPRADRVLDVILGQSGMVLSSIAGSPAVAQTPTQGSANADLTGLIPQA